jgi:hypothetical protein
LARLRRRLLGEFESSIFQAALAYLFRPLCMKRQFGIYLAVVALLLTWPLHIGAASFVLAEFIGELFSPKSDHVLSWFAIAGVGGVLTITLATGIVLRRRGALYVSAVALIGGLWALWRFSQHSSYDWAFQIALTMLLVVSALYLWWTARHTRSISDEN